MSPCQQYISISKDLRTEVSMQRAWMFPNQWLHEIAKVLENNFALYTREQSCNKCWRQSCTKMLPHIDAGRYYPILSWRTSSHIMIERNFVLCLKVLPCSVFKDFALYIAERWRSCIEYFRKCHIIKLKVAPKTKAMKII